MTCNARIYTSIAAAGLLFAGGIANAADAKAADPKVQAPVNVESMQTISATVTAVDVQKRLVTLKGPEGKTATIEVRPDVRNLAQVKVGDQLVVRYYESIGAAMKPKGSPATPPDSAAAAARAAPGEMPAAAVGQVSTTTITIMAFDKKSNMLTFSGADGLVRAAHIKDPKGQQFAGTLKQGDQVDLTYTEALAVSVEPAAKK
jgi:hypothetical protein